jgi:hypothetical protein
MDKVQFKDPKKAQAAIAFLIAEGWGIDLAKLNKELPGGIQDKDWLAIANGCLNWCLDRMAEDKIIPIEQFSKLRH